MGEPTATRLAAWSQKPYAEQILFWFALAESCVMPIPVEPLLLTLCTGTPQRSLRFALICGVGSVLGGLLGYAIGHYAFDSVGQALLNLYDPHHKVFHQVEETFAQWGFWGILLAAITPIPYKIFTLTSGVLDFDLGQFVLASVIGRNAKFLVIGGLMTYGGDRLRTWVESSSNRLLWLGLVITIAGLFAVKLL
ncbi:MAG TPA: YqaA family protein [Candidatus Obscuribacterales bacterium]